MGRSNQIKQMRRSVVQALKIIKTKKPLPSKIIFNNNLYSFIKPRIEKEKQKEEMVFLTGIPILNSNQIPPAAMVLDYEKRIDIIRLKDGKIINSVKKTVVNKPQKVDIEQPPKKKRKWSFNILKWFKKLFKK